jgi:hypothetical protein
MDTTRPLQQVGEWSIKVLLTIVLVMGTSCSTPSKSESPAIPDVGGSAKMAQEAAATPSPQVTPAPPGDAINVKSFGAKGDGVTDDTAALRAAANAVKSSFRLYKTPGGHYIGNSKELFFPQGNYIVSDEIAFSTPYITVRGADAIIRQTANARIFFFGDDAGSASQKVILRGLQFIGGSRQVTFSNNNIDKTMLRVEDSEFREATDTAVYAAGTSGDRHMSCSLTIENVKFIRGAAALYNSCDYAMIRDSWVDVAAPTLKANSAVYTNVTGNLRLENVVMVPAITDAPSRVPGVHWIKMLGGNLWVRSSRFGGEGAGYPIVSFESSGVLEGGHRGTAATYPFMGSAIVIEDSMMAAGGSQSADSAVINITGGMPHLMRLVGNYYFLDAPYVRIQNPENAKAYVAASRLDPTLIFKFVFEPNMALPKGRIPDILVPYVYK